MPLELQIITVKEFVRFGAHGTIDWRKSHQLLRELARSCVARGTDRALLDVRDTTSNLTVEQIASLVLTFRNSGLNEHQRIAVLHGSGPAPRAELFADYATQRGWNVATFSRYEEAVDWLSVVEETDSGLHMYNKATETPDAPPPPAEE